MDGARAARSLDSSGTLYILAWRDVKVCNKQSAMGVAWVILQPLLTMFIFPLLFGRLARMPSEGRVVTQFADLRRFYRIPSHLIRWTAVRSI
jgi:ABC-type polysaccharide/polyol phosphate export permease